MSALFSVFFLFFLPLFAESPPFFLPAEAVLLMNAKTGTILYEKNGHKPLYPASTTKIATAAYVLQLRGEKLETLIQAEQDAIGWISAERKELSNYRYPAHWLEPGATHINIKRGEELVLRDLLFAMMVASADDAANVIAQYIGGTVATFMEDLNGWLEGVGCCNTRFVNPHGLHHPDHITTAYDLALIMREAMKIPLFREMVATRRYERPKTVLQEGFPLIQTNRLVRSGSEYYPKALGGKTGYTAKAGHSLVAVATDGEREVIVVLLKVKKKEERFRLARRLFEYAFAVPKKRVRLFQRGLQKFTLDLPDEGRRIPTFLEEDLEFTYYIDEPPELSWRVEWEPVSLPVKRGQRVGRLLVSEQKSGSVIWVPLLAQKRVERSWWQRNGLSVRKGIAFSAALFLFGGLFFQLVKKR